MPLSIIESAPQYKSEKGTTMSNAVVTKQSQPSAPGTVVDTSAAKVVPTSSEVRTEAANREVAAQGKASREKIGALAKGMTHPSRAKAEAVAKVTGKKAPKAKAAKKAPKRSTNGSGPLRLTDSWKGKGGKEVEVGSVVKAPGIASLTIVGRWTKHRKDGLIPFVTGTTPDGTRKNVAAADCTVVKAPKK